MKKLQKDMTEGRPGKIILDFTIPIFLGNVFQQFYNMADAVIVGKFVGTQALAAVGSTGTISFLVLGFVMGMTTGFTVTTAQKFGAGDMKAMRQTIGNAVILSAIVAVVMTAFSLLFMKPILQLMHTPEDIFEDAYGYMLVVSIGIAAILLYNLTACFLRAIGNSKIPLYFLIISSAANIVLDLIFVLVFKWGVIGAAIATVTAQGASGILCLIYIARKVEILCIDKADLKPIPRIMKNQLRVGIPMALQFSITALGTMMVQTALNLLGSVMVAAFTAASKIEMLVTQAYMAIGATMSTYCAQNMGAGKIKRIRRGFKSAMIISSVYSVVVGVFILTAGKYLTYLFLSGDVATVMDAVEIYLKCIAPFFIPLAAVNVFRNGIQGMGYGLLPMTAGIVELVGRGAAAAVAAKSASYIGVCMANPAAWVLAAGFLVCIYFYIMNHDMKRFEKKELRES